jgi:hypothetical protein
MKKTRSSTLLPFLIMLYSHILAQGPHPIFSTADSGVTVFMGATVKTTMLYSGKRVAPSTGTAFLLLPRDATGRENTFDVNARSSTLYFAVDGPKLGDFRFGGKMVFYMIRDLADPSYGLLPALMYADLRNDKWRIAIGQQVDVFAQRIPNLIDGYFALASSGCVGNSSRGQIRAEHYIPAGPDGKVTLTLAASQPVSTYYSKDLKNNSENNGVPNAEWAVKYQSGADPNAWVPFDRVELAFSGVAGSYRVFKNDTAGVIIINKGINKPKVRGYAGEFAFRLSKRFGIQGELYTGQALGNYLGGILQTTKGENDREVHSGGFWAEAALYWKKNLQTRFGYGQDLCRREDLIGGGILKNSTCFGNLIWDLRSNVETGVELTYKQTKYAPVSSKDNQGMTFMLMVAYKF